MGIRLNDMVVGDTWSFATTASDYPADAWTLTLYLVPRFSAPVQSVIDLTSTPDTDDALAHRFAVAAAVTATYAAGKYAYYTVASDGVQRFTLDAAEWSGEVRLLADPAALAQGHDGRSDAQKALDNAKQALFDAQSRAASSNGSTVLEYQIGDRRMKYADAATATSSLIIMVQYLEREVARERRAEAIRRGLADPRKVYVRAYRA